MTAAPSTESVERALRLGAGFTADERPEIVDAFVSLDHRLRSFPDGTVDLLLTIKERDGAGQRTTLETQISGAERVVAISERRDLAAALIDVRDETVRQITDAKNKTETRNNRHLRSGPPDTRSA